MIRKVKEGIDIFAKAVEIFLKIYVMHKETYPTFIEELTKNNFKSMQMHNLLYSRFSNVLAMKHVLGFSEEEFSNFLLQRGYKLLWDEYKDSRGYMLF